MPAPCAYTLSSNQAQAFLMLIMLQEGQPLLRKLFLAYSCFMGLDVFVCVKTLRELI